MSEFNLARSIATAMRELHDRRSNGALNTLTISLLCLMVQSGWYKR